MIDDLQNTNGQQSSNKAYVIFDIGSRDCQQSIQFYKLFPNATIFAFECNPSTLKICEQNIIPYQDRITIMKGAVSDYYGDIDICYINDYDFKFIKDKIALNRLKLLVNSSKTLFDNSNSNLEMFCIYHKNYYFREDNFYFTFFGVNEVYSKEKTCNNILEYELDKYNPFLQKRGYMESSSYLHVYWNKLYKRKDMVGFSQYDMKHNQIYNNLDKKTIYLLNTNKPIVKNGKWDSLMFPTIRNLDFLIKSYNNHFKKSYTMKELENQPLSLWQTNIYPVAVYEKLCGWLEQLVDEIYPWSNQPPYETHFGSIGGYTERALSIFNAFEIFEGMPYSNLNIQHGIGAEVKEQYSNESFLNNYSQDIHCKIVEKTDNTKDYCIVGIDNQKNAIIRQNINGITQLFYTDEKGNRSKPLMIIGNSNDNTFIWKYNILHCNLNDYEILYKKVGYNSYNILLTKFYYSRGLLDKMIYMNFINQINNDGIMIEIGGHIGDKGGSNTYFFEKYLGYKTFLIEPSEQSFKELVKNRPNSININKAVSYKKEMVKLYGNNEVASTIANGREFQIVQGEPIKDMLEKYQLQYVDLFVIDTEGSELDVLETFDWNIEVGVILIELLSEHPSGNHSSHLNKDKKVIDFLISKNFTYQFSDNEMTNQIWINEKYSRKNNLFKGVQNKDTKLLQQNHYLQRNYRYAISKNKSISKVPINDVITHFITKEKQYEKYFCIGLHKTGTSTLHKIAIKSNLKSIHHPHWNIMDNILNKYDFFCDGGGIYDTDNSMDFDYKKLESQYHNSFFIINIRNIETWIVSKLKHAGWNLQTKIVKDKKSYVHEEWKIKSKKNIILFIQHYLNKYIELLSYFNNKTNCMLIGICEDLNVEKLCKMLNYTYKDKIHENQSSNTILSKEVLDLIHHQIYIVNEFKLKKLDDLLERFDNKFKNFNMKTNHYNCNKANSNVFDSSKHWQNRYLNGQNSDSGSYGRLAQWKAEVINNFIKNKKIQSIIDYGVGDGNQLSLYDINDITYCGIDVSKVVIDKLSNKYKNDTTKQFHHVSSKILNFTSELTISCDVLYHLIEDDVYVNYLNNLFRMSEKYVIVYAKALNQDHKCEHVKFRNFIVDIEKLYPEWKLFKCIPNKYPVNDIRESNEHFFSDFYIYEKTERKKYIFDEVYISLTSIFDNQDVLVKTLNSILDQTMLPDKIFVHLSVESYLKDVGFKDRKITNENLRGLFDKYTSLIQVKWVSNIGPYRKLIPIIEEKIMTNQNIIIITIDDDVEYNKDLIKNMVNSYVEHECVISCRTHAMYEMDLKNHKNILYQNISRCFIKKHLYNFHTGKGAVLYPLYLFRDGLILNGNMYSLIPTTDDIWFNYCRILNNIECFSLNEDFDFLKKDNETIFALSINFNCGKNHGKNTENMNLILNRLNMEKYRFPQNFSIGASQKSVIPNIVPQSAETGPERSSRSLERSGWVKIAFRIQWNASQTPKSA